MTYINAIYINTIYINTIQYIPTWSLYTCFIRLLLSSISFNHTVGLQRNPSPFPWSPPVTCRCETHPPPC